MLVLEYKYNTKSPSLKPSTTNTSDIISGDIEPLQSIARSARKYRHILYPIEDIMSELKLSMSVDELVREELAHIASELLTDVNIDKSKFSLTPITKWMSTTPTADVDVIYLTNINSRAEVSRLSDISSAYDIVYLIKPKLEDPLSDKVYVLLANHCAKTTSEQSLMIYRLSHILDFGLAMYTYMQYCVSMADSISPPDGIAVNAVKIDNIALPVEAEYGFYIQGIKEYCREVIKE